MAEWHDSEDGEHVRCPKCGERWADLWDYDWRTREVIDVECPFCAADLHLRQSVIVEYSVAVREAEA